MSECWSEELNKIHKIALIALFTYEPTSYKIYEPECLLSSYKVNCAEMTNFKLDGISQQNQRAWANLINSYMSLFYERKFWMILLETKFFHFVVFKEWETNYKWFFMKILLQQEK